MGILGTSGAKIPAVNAYMYIYTYMGVLASSGAKIPAVNAIRAIRVLRAVRLLKKSKSLKPIVDALSTTIGPVLNSMVAI